MTLRPKWQNFQERKWEEIRDSWLASIPVFPTLGARPEPGLELLPGLLKIDIPTISSRHPDVAGLRNNTLWEAIFLFHKCSHISLAAQRLALQGMQSWCLFNAYHSAYLGARGIMALLGVALPNLHGNQVALDLYPLSSSKKKGRGMGSPQFEEFLLVKLPILDQRNLWEAFQRLLQITQAGCWDAGLRQELLDLTFSTITPPRNRFLYKAHFWPLSDLTSDLDPADFRELYGEEMDSEDPGFLLRLCFAVYRLFEQLMINLATYSKAVKTQFDGSRFLLDSGQPELTSYAIFVAQVSTATGSI